MGNYLNPGDDGFRKAANSRIYVDKTMLLSHINGFVNEDCNCVAVSHARRFGKSQAACMLDAYYSIGCESRDLFERFEIAKETGWDRYLNRFQVIHLDMATLLNAYSRNLVESLKALLCDELRNAFPDLKIDMEIETDTATGTGSGNTALLRPFPAVLKDVYHKTGVQFVIIIDEWDCVIRNNAKDEAFVHEYMRFLHDIFKSRESKSFLALGYITGILPIKKSTDESALNNFSEYTMTGSDELTPFFGFTGKEAARLCDMFDMDYESVKAWYDGYEISGEQMYNPNSVYLAIQRKALRSYWKNTASFDSINTYITMNFGGLKDDILKMLSGGRASVDVEGFTNDLSIIQDKDDALTALIHLGYLAYDAATSEAYVPNYEVALAYKSALKNSGWTKVAESIDTAQAALNALLGGRNEEFGSYIDLAHEAYTSIMNYNDENTLYGVLYMTLFTARAYYNVERELPSGKGFADMVLLPRKDAGTRPAVVLELKYDKTADTAIRQIREKRYAGKLSGYADRVLLAGISYNKETKKHECVIEEK